MVVDSVALRALVPAATTVADGAKRLASSMRKGTVIAMANDREDGFVVSERGSEPIPRGGPGNRDAPAQQQRPERQHDEAAPFR